MDKYPAVSKYLRRFEEQLKARPEVKRGTIPWYALSRYAADYWQEFDGAKIIYQEIATYHAFAFDESGIYSNNKTYLIPCDNLSLLGCLNSKLTWWFLHQVCSKLQGGALAMQTPYISQIPILEATPKQQAPIVKLVDQILAAKRADPQANVSEWEREIDRLVYQLYELTPAEIAVVEGSARP